MADTNMPAGEDPKAVKAKLKADKKEYQKQLKEQRKSQKARAQEFADRQAELYGDNAGGFATIVITFLIILIWLIIMGLLIKLDVGGFGSDILAPIIKDVPYLNLILPDSVLKEMQNEPVTDVSTTDSSADGIDSLEAANAYIKRLEQALQSEMEMNSSYASTIERLEAEVTRLEPFEQQQKDFYEERAAFYSSVVYGDYAPDAAAYASYYAMIDPDTAARLYEQVVEKEIEDDAIKAFVTTYSGMKAKTAAAVFDQMVSENQMELVSRILAQMSTENRSDILAAMEKPNAAKLTLMLEPDALEKESPQVTGDYK
jgi:flagellar motility protein MotE (MotC chaperone)